MSKYDKIENATFYDGFLYIIYDKSDESVKRPDFKKMGCDRIFLCSQFTEPWTLSLIAERVPPVKIVIFESFEHGEIYSYGNHKPGEWERVGEMIGFAGGSRL